jgi:hypothetical protein
VFDTSSSYATQSDLAPGQTTSFEVSAFGSVVDKVKTFKLYADSSEYFLLLELGPLRYYGISDLINYSLVTYNFESLD